MQQDELALMAHLMRRAGFGATRDELERYVAKGYETTVEELLHPEETPAVGDEDLVRRYHIDENAMWHLQSGQAYWFYRMINTKQPLEERIVLFWHQVFATGYSKLDNANALILQLDMFRRHGLGSFRDLLVRLSRDPAMIFWLDNKDNHGEAVNENYGRELLELFSMGVGNYTEDDVRQASRAFTGWTLLNAPYHAARVARDSLWPYGRIDWLFEYQGNDHDAEVKSFLGHTGDFNGEDIIDIVCQQPATARFIARHLYNFFVADEVQVPAWNTVPARDPEAIQALMNAFVENSYEIRPVLRVLFNSEFFKEAAFARVKSPAEFVVAVARTAGAHRFPDVDDVSLGLKTGYMGQQLLDPPSVEGWHTGKEWINTLGLVNRVNFAVEIFSEASRPGVRSIIDRVRAQSPRMSPEQLVDACLAEMGPLTVSETSRAELLAHAVSRGDVRSDGNGTADERVLEMLQLIVSTREYQFA